MVCYVMCCHGNVMLCYVMLFHFMLYYFMLCYVMLCHVTLSYVMLCHVMGCYVMLCTAMLYYAMLCYGMLCYVMLCYGMISYVLLCYVNATCVRARYVMLWYGLSTCQIEYLWRDALIFHEANLEKSMKLKISVASCCSPPPKCGLSWTISLRTATGVKIEYLYCYSKA